MNYKKTLLIALGILTLLIVGVWSYMYYSSPQAAKLTSPEGQAARAEVLNRFNANDLDGAIASAQKLVKNDNSENSLLGLLQLANAYVQKAGFSSSSSEAKEYANKAIDSARQVLLIDLENQEAYRVTGYAYEILQDYPNAEKNYTKALQIDPKFDLALSNRGHLYELMGDRDKAFADYNAAYAINTKGDFTQLNLARYYFETDEPGQATVLAKGAISSSNNARLKSMAHEVLGNIYFSAGSTTEALAEFNTAISIDAAYADPYFDRSFLTMSLADEKGMDASTTKTVLGDIEQGLAINPAKAFGYFLTGMVYYSGDKAKAKAGFEKALGMVDADVTVVGQNKTLLKQDIQEQLSDLSK